MYISTVTGAAAPPSCTSKLALQLLLHTEKSLLWCPVLTYQCALLFQVSAWAEERGFEGPEAWGGA